MKKLYFPMTVSVLYMEVECHKIIHWWLEWHNWYHNNIFCVTHLVSRDQTNRWPRTVRWWAWRPTMCDCALKCKLSWESEASCAHLTCFERPASIHHMRYEYGYVRQRNIKTSGHQENHIYNDKDDNANTWMSRVYHDREVTPISSQFIVL